MGFTQQLSVYRNSRKNFIPFSFVATIYAPNNWRHLWNSWRSRSTEGLLVSVKALQPQPKVVKADVQNSFLFLDPLCGCTVLSFFRSWAHNLRQNANQLLLWKPLRGPSDLLTDRPLWLSLQVSACLSVSCSLQIYSISTLHLKVHYLSWEQKSLEETSAGVKLITDCLTIVTLLVYI